MDVIDFPLGRVGGERIERAALRTGLGTMTALRRRLRVVAGGGRLTRACFCARCAAPIDFAPVVRGTDTFCSVECSLGDGRPA